MIQTIGSRATRFAHAAVETLFPPLCAGCGDETGAAATLCAACWRELDFLAGPGCGRCGRDVAGLEPGEAFTCDECLTHPPAWTRGVAVFAYEGTGRRLVMALKHGDRLDIAWMLAGWMERAGRPLVAGADLIVPVPLHWTRRVRRRFNQSVELARALGRRTGRQQALRPDILVRTRRTASQKGRNRDARDRNLAGALAVPEGRRAAVAGRRVLLIDDVMTTGATLNAGARALLDAGATQVDILVMALVSAPARSYLDARSEEDAQP